MSPQPIPASLAPFFQEYSLADLDIERSAYTIIERTLQYGNRAEIHWLFTSYTPARIAAWFDRCGETLPEPHRSFWRLILSQLAPVQDSPLIGPSIRIDPVQAASVLDIGLMKLDALLGRASRQDFHDLYVICQQVPLRRLLDLAPNKYPSIRDFESQVAKRLVYFEHADLQEPVPLMQPVAWENVKAYFRQQATALGLSWLP